MQALEGFDDFVFKALDKWQVPGVAVGVIKDGEVILSEGYGYRNLADSAPTTPQTLFQIASITKSFTATAAAILVDQGKLDWDTPIYHYLPEFKLSDAVISERVTIRDCLTHLTGLPRHDMLWMLTGHNREEVLQRLQYLPLSAGLREKWQYNNLMYMVAGYLTGQLAGMTWEAFLHQAFFKPLGMSSTHFLRELEPQENQATPYYLADGEHKIPGLEWDAKNSCAPAGHILSNVEDMLPYLQLHLNAGKHDGQALFSDQAAAAIYSAYSPIEEVKNFNEIGPVSTCMGFQQSTYRGHRYLHHDGSSIGYTTRFSFMPEENFGFVILSNLLGFNNGNPLPWIIARNLEDRLLGLEPIDWQSRLEEKFKRLKAKQQAASNRAKATTIKNTQPSHAPAQYIGTYQHPAYGKIQIDEADGQNGTLFKWSFNEFESILKHLHYDSFIGPQDVPYVVDPMCSRILTFHANNQGEIDHLTTLMEAGFDDVKFHRVSNQGPKTEAIADPFHDSVGIQPWQN